MSLHRQLISYRYPARRGARSVKVGTSRRLPPCVIPDRLQTACKMPSSLLADAKFSFGASRLAQETASTPSLNPRRPHRPPGKCTPREAALKQLFLLVFHQVRGGVAQANPCAAIASSARGSLARTEAVWSEPLPESIKMPRASPAASLWAPKAPSRGCGKTTKMCKVLLIESVGRMAVRSGQLDGKDFTVAF
jgi:hypothetical protein